jgi:hypothetical protein
MKMRHRQSGMSVLGMLVIAIMLGFFAMCAMRMTPPYMEYLTVKKIVSETATEETDGAVRTIPDIRRRIGNLFNTNQIYALSPRDIKVYRKEGITYIDASYEVRTPVFGRIDSIMNFDDLKYVVGEPLQE